MKRRILALLCLSVLCTVLLSGCRCKPEKLTWYATGFKKTESFANGTTFTVSHTGIPSSRDPYGGMDSGFVGISFSEDGTVVFQPGTGEVLTGTYTSDVGRRSTKIAVTLSDGESFTATARSNAYGSSLALTFRGSDYLFEDIRTDPQVYYQNNLKQLCDTIRYWAENPGGEIPVNACNIFTHGNYYVLESEILDDVVLLDDSVAVRCFRMDENNQLYPMDTIVEGTCFFDGETFDGVTYVTLYYIEIASQ